MRTQRFEELMEGMKSFGKENYHKSELLEEMFALQNELIELTFSNDHAATAKLKIWDVERHLEQMNRDNGNVAEEELSRFEEGCKEFCSLIRAEISGNRGEYKVFKELEYLEPQNKVLKNIELREGDTRTELDAVVITSKCVTIVEVKNTSKNIFIDDEGNFYRTGECLKWDCNIAEKMSAKESLLKNVLVAAGYGHIQVRSLLVFTNNRIEVQNKYRQIRICFVNQLPFIIDKYRLDNTIGTEEMNELQEVIKKAECKEAYPFEFDVKQFKQDFANLMVKLEFANIQKEEVMKVVPAEETFAEEKPQETFFTALKSVTAPIMVKYAGRAAAFAVTVVSGIIVINTIKKGGI